ncbi:MAG TPA: hypothetical protein VGR16_10125 [Thermomicrobiales bacterium]|nr:hypothetical protein [Thermomicrobiales bacterium]
MTCDRPAQTMEATAIERGRLRSRPTQPRETTQPGLHRLGLDPVRDAILAIPATYRPEHPAPFVLSLHGAGGDAQAGLYPLREQAETAGVVLLSPAARRPSWDVIRGDYGPDVAFLDRALDAAFARVDVDPDRLAIGGFSDGASYALSLGITNGDLFRHILAFSPGFMVPAAQHGEPRIFVSHGVDDAVLPIGSCSRRLVPALRRAHYDVTYREFDGGHTVPPEIASEALTWFLGTNA